MRKLLAVLFLFSGTLLVSACITHHGKFTLIATRPVNLDYLDLETLPSKKTIKSESSGDTLLSIVRFGEMRTTPEDAIDKIFTDEKFGNLFVDATIVEISTYAYYLVEQKFIVKGTIVKVPNNRTQEN